MTIIGCGIFRREVEHLRPELENRARWLSPGLHTDLEQLGRELAEKSTDGCVPTFLFGAACHPDLSQLAGEAPGSNFPGKDCVAVYSWAKKSAGHSRPAKLA